MATILLIDDQPLMAAALAHLLSNEPDLQLHVCSQLADAWEAVATLSPGLILLEPLIAGGAGLELVGRLRDDLLSAGTPLVALSHSGALSVKLEAFSLGVDDYLVKLPESEELLARLRYQLGTAARQQQRELVRQQMQRSLRQLEVANQELERLSLVDGLTALANRRHFDRYLHSEWMRACRVGSSLSLMMVDIDFFKAYNDIYGHLRGDQCLRRVALAIAGVVSRGGDLAARFGGEEFALVLPDTRPHGVLSIANKLQQRLKELKIPHRGSQVSESVTVSIGVVSRVPQPSECQAELLDQADQALYAAKRQGRARVVSFATTLSEEPTE